MNASLRSTCSLAHPFRKHSELVPSFACVCYCNASPPSFVTYAAWQQPAILFRPHVEKPTARGTTRLLPNFKILMVRFWLQRMRLILSHHVTTPPSLYLRTLSHLASLSRRTLTGTRQSDHRCRAGSGVRRRCERHGRGARFVRWY